MKSKEDEGNGLRSDYIMRIGKLCLKKKVHVMPSDYFYKLNQINVGDSFVLNLDDSSQRGSHWVGLFISHTPKKAIFMDPLGMPLVNTYIRNGLMKHDVTDITYSKKSIQIGTSFHCGFFVIAFLVIMSKGKSLSQFISMFSEDDLRGNEQIATSIIEKQLKKMH